MRFQKSYGGGGFKQGFEDATYDPSQQVLPIDKAVLCRIIQHSRPLWLLSRLLNFDTNVDYPLFHDLWWSIYPDKGNPQIEFKLRKAKCQYLQLHADMKEEDRPSEISERKHFIRRSQVDLTVSRKLTLVSQWALRYNQSTSPGLRPTSAAFIAEKTLWNWIDRCLMAHGDGLTV